MIASSVEQVRQRLAEAIEVKRRMLDDGCLAAAAEVADRITESIRGGGKVLFFGNGGSAMDAGHLAAELVGRFYLEREALAAVSLPDATATLTAVGNDYAYDEVFARQVRALGRPGDVAVGLSTSGGSANVVKALRAARDGGLLAVALTGAAGGAAAEVAHLAVRVPTDDTPRVQEACMHLGHTICELVEAALAASYPVYPADPLPLTGLEVAPPCRRRP